MNLFRFISVEQSLHSSIGSYHSFGIRADEQTSEGWKDIAFVSDVSLNGDFVARLAHLYSAHQLSPVHFMDALYDALP